MRPPVAESATVELDATFCVVAGVVAGDSFAGERSGFPIVFFGVEPAVLPPADELPITNSFLPVNEFGLSVILAVEAG